jgi:PepSY-associated transmembrane protein
MKARALHRIIGLVMLLPLIGWAVTGSIFFLKPGYAGAYDTPQVKTYPLETNVALEIDRSWLEFRYVKTILGEHLLARTEQGWQHLDPHSLQPKPAPTEDEIRALIADAVTTNPSRYEHIASVKGNTATTDTNVRVTIDWNRLALAQRGADTERIDFFYKIHYLQLTGVATVDKALGALAIALVLILSVLGVRLFFSKG